MVRNHQKELYEELASCEILTHEYDTMVLKCNRLEEQLAKTLQDNAVMLNRRTQYNFNITIQFDQILRENSTALYLEENLSTAVSYVKYFVYHIKTYVCNIVYYCIYVGKSIRKWCFGSRPETWVL
jgi:hypothetical protein